MGTNTTSQMSVFQQLIPTDTCQCKEHATGEEYLLQLLLTFIWVNTQLCMMSFWVCTTRGEIRSLTFGSDFGWERQQWSNKWRKHLQRYFRSSSVRLEKHRRLSLELNWDSRVHQRHFIFLWVKKGTGEWAYKLGLLGRSLVTSSE